MPKQEYERHAFRRFAVSGCQSVKSLKITRGRFPCAHFPVVSLIGVCSEQILAELCKNLNNKINKSFEYSSNVPLHLLADSDSPLTHSFMWMNQMTRYVAELLSTGKFAWIWLADLCEKRVLATREQQTCP